MEVTRVYWGSVGDNGNEHGSCYDVFFVFLGSWAYFGGYRESMRIVQGLRVSCMVVSTHVSSSPCLSLGSYGRTLHITIPQ